MAEPKVRFKNEDGSNYPAWRTVTIGEILEKQSIPVSVEKETFYREIGIRSHGKGLFHKEPVQGFELGNKRVFEIVPDCLVLNIVFAWERAVSKTTNDEVGMIASHRFPMYKPKIGILDLDYIVRYLITDEGKQLLELASPGGAGRNRTLGQKEFANSKLPLPCYEEQRKISGLLTDLDEIITSTENEFSNLEMQKKAVMKKIFSQEVRFTSEDGTDFSEWREQKLSDFARRVPRKNKDNKCSLPLTISAEYGLIDQSVFFNKTIASKDMSTYYLLRKGEFAYNKSTSKDYSVGAIKRLDLYEEGAVSPLYICFELYSDDVLSDFAVQYFETDCWHQGVLDIAQEGARTHGLLNISVSGFFETTHTLPSSIEEQRLIANFLSDFDEAIAAAKRELELWKELKKGLLQQMFV